MWGCFLGELVVLDVKCVAILRLVISPDRIIPLQIAYARSVSSIHSSGRISNYPDSRAYSSNRDVGREPQHVFSPVVEALHGL